MNFETAFATKEKIAEEVVFPSRKVARIFATMPTAGSGNTATLSIPNRTNREIKQGILGVGITKSKDGEHLIKLFVQDQLRLPNDRIARYFNVKESEIIFKQAKPLRLFLTKLKQRPPFPGISVGHYKGMTGTLGAVVQDSKGTKYILSNNHILANSNSCMKGDKILQPGLDDNGKYEDDVIAHLHDYIPIDLKSVNSMDAAIAKLEIDIEAHEIPYCGPILGSSIPEIDAKVRKYGRTTMETEGVILSTGVSIPVLFNNTEVSFTNLFEVQGVDIKGQMVDFSRGGDSGSLIVDVGQKKAVGLLFAGLEGDTTFACPIQPILEALGVDLIHKSS